MVGSTNEQHMASNDFIRNKMQEDLSNLYGDCDGVCQELLVIARNIGDIKQSIVTALCKDEITSKEEFEILRYKFSQILKSIEGTTEWFDAEQAPVEPEQEIADDEEGNTGPDNDLDEVEDKPEEDDTPEHLKNQQFTEEKDEK